MIISTFSKLLLVIGSAALGSATYYEQECPHECKPPYWCPDFSRPKDYKSLPWHFGDCECYDGYRKDYHLEKCIPDFHCPENSHPIVDHPETFCDCECEPGFIKEGKKCVKKECKIQVDKKVRVVPPPPPPVSGNLCELDGEKQKLEGLDLLFNLSNDLITDQETPKKADILEPIPAGVTCANGPFRVEFTDKGDDILAEDVLSCGEVLEVSGKFSSESVINVFFGNQLIQSAKIHTSCSQPLKFADVYGSFTIVGFDPEDGNKVEFTPMDDDKLKELLIPGKYDPDGGVEAHVGDYIVFTNIVKNLGDFAINDVDIRSVTGLIDGGQQKEFVPKFFAGDSNEDGLLDPDEEWVYIAYFKVTESTPVGHYICFTFVTGDGFLPKRSCKAEDKVTYKIVEKPKFVGDICEDDFCDKPVAITFRYQAGTEADITNEQEGKASVDGNNDPAAAPATIFVEKYDFEAQNLLPGDVFEVTNSGDKFDSNTEIEIFNTATGAFVQFIEYHTSCSKPINIGDVIGSLVVESVTCENGNTF